MKRSEQENAVNGQKEKIQNREKKWILKGNR